MVTKAYITGRGGSQVPLLADKPLNWEQTKGITPYQTIINTLPEFSGKVKKMSGGLVDLVIDPGGNELKVQKLYITEFPAPQHPKVFSFVLSDCRWLWTYYHICSRYNVRRRIGFKRVPAPNEELAEVREEIFYKAYSLKDPEKQFPDNKWTAKDALEDIMKRLLRFEGSNRGTGTRRGYKFDRDLLGHVLKDIPLEDVEIDDSGDMAIARLISRLPMVNLCIDYDGEVRFYNTLSGEERVMAERLGPEIFGTGHIGEVDNSNIRPSKVHVLFTKEIEVRFDAKSEPKKSVEAEDDGDGDDIPDALKPSEKAKIHLLENVLPIPDYKLKVTINPDQAFGADDLKQDLAQGTWINFHQALNAWADPENLDADDTLGIWPFLPEGVVVDHGFIRKAMVPWQDLWSGVVAAGQMFPSALHGSRLLSIPAHWRRSYRIPNQWVDGCLSIKNYRISTVDQETGTRAPSMVFANYTIAHTMRNIFKGIDFDGGGYRGGQAPSAYWKVYGYPGAHPDNPNPENFPVHPDHPAFTMGVIDSYTKASPATVNIVDEDQGILRIDWRVDPLNLMDVIIPGFVEENKVVDPADASGSEHQLGQDIKTWAARGGVPRGWNWVKASSEGMRINRMERHLGMATILTMIPAAPNDISQLYRVEVEPKDISKLLPEAARAGLKNANGPELIIRVGPGVATARFAWKDTAEHAQTTRNCFGLPRPHPDIEGGEIIGGVEEEDLEFKDDTLINKGDSGNKHTIAHTDELKGPDLDNLALAVAAKVYAGFTDKLSGSVEGMIDRRIRIDGFIGSVGHSVDPSGVTTTSLRLAEPVPELDIFSILDENSRNQIMRLVQHK